MSNRIIVSRHPAAIEFIARELLADEWSSGDCWADTTEERDCVTLKNSDTSEWVRVPVLAAATMDDVRGMVVYGNIPLHLATVAASVIAIEFAGAPPRGQEYSLADMDAAGARLVRYRVASLT